MFRRSVRAIFGLLIFVGLALSHTPGADPTSLDLKTDRLVQAALQSEIEGDAAGRRRMLQEALRVSEDCAAAHWQLGHVQRDGQWLTIEEAQRRARADTRMTEYWKIANAASMGLKDQLRLARWCDKQGLDDLARLHWYRVFQHQPKNKEAARRLGLKEHHGRFLMEGQIAAAQRYEAAKERWEPKIIAWRTAIDHGTPEKRDLALKELRSVTDVQAVPFLIDQLADDSELAKEVVNVLSRMDPFETYGWLAKFSVSHDNDQVRELATERLASLVQQSPGIGAGVLPMLLSTFQVPVEFSYYVSTLSVVGYTLSQPGPFYDLEWTHTDASRFDVEVSFAGSDGIEASLPLVQMLDRQQRIAEQRAAQRAVARAARVKNAVDQRNVRAQAYNQRVFRALCKVTGQEQPDSPQAWWDWWQKENERRGSQQKPVYRQTSLSRTQNTARISVGHTRPAFSSSVSCFVRGTPVWTETGRKPIEEVRVGQRVLSQNAETGELDYRFVVQTTIRPPSETLRVKVGDEEIWTTLGHLFWVSGKGWTMAKQLEVGDVLHGAESPKRITRIESGPKAEAHNLVIADFNTYFVGRHKVLVHDNMPHVVSPTLVPGLLVVD